MLFCVSYLERVALWQVYCGDDAYDIIDRLTGSDMQFIREEIIDFSSDLSNTFWTDLSSQLTDLTTYLQW